MKQVHRSTFHPRKLYTICICP